MQLPSHSNQHPTLFERGIEKYTQDRQLAFARLCTSRSTRLAALARSGAEGKRQRDENVVDAHTEGGPTQRTKDKTPAAELAITAEMKALEKSKDADMLVAQLTPAHNALIEQCAQSAKTAAAAAQQYVPCAEQLACIAAKEREREMLLLSVLDMKTSCQTAVESYAHSQSMLFEATGERAAAQTEVDDEKMGLQELLRGNDDAAIVASSIRLQQKIAHRDTTGLSIPELTQQDVRAAENATTEQMLVHEADLMCVHLDKELVTLKQTMDAAQDLCTGPLARLISSNDASMQESLQVLDQAIHYQKLYSETHRKLFLNLSNATLKHMLRVTYGSEPSGNERADLQRDILKARERAAETWKQLYDPSIVEARYQVEREEVAAKSQQETNTRAIAYFDWAQRAGMLTSDATGPSTDPDDTDYQQEDEAALDACCMLQVLPMEVCYAHTHTLSQTCAHTCSFTRIHWHMYTTSSAKSEVCTNYGCYSAIVQVSW